MAISKNASRVAHWREYFRSANANIFEIIEGAIMVAASDCPKEYKLRRERIAILLYNCKLIKCPVCDVEELALPVDDQNNNDDDDDNDHHDHDHDHDDDEGIEDKSKLTHVDGNWSKGSSKVIYSSTNDDEDDDAAADNNDDVHDHHHDHVELNESNNQVSNYSYGDAEAEALTNEIEQESLTFDEVLRIKEIVDNSPDETVSSLCNSLRKLQLMAISVETLKATEIGKSVNVLRKHGSKDVRQIARSLIEVWKDMVDEWVNTTTKMTVSEATPESMNPSGLDEEEEGLPSPPLDDLAFLNPHSISLEFNEFFDGMDDYGNPRKSRESNKNSKPPVEKQNITKSKQQKPLNAPTMVPKNPTAVKPTKPLVNNPSPGRLMKPNMERKLQNPEKPTLQKKPVTPQQRKMRPSEEETEKEKLEATKRKLQERYQQAENAKRQRTIQVMELHDLPKQSIAPKNQHMRPGNGNNHNRNWGHGRC